MKNKLKTKIFYDKKKFINKNIFVIIKNSNWGILTKNLQSNLYKTTTLGTTQKRSSWASGHYKTHKTAT